MRIFEHISFYSGLDLTTLSNALERVLLLKPFEYDWENDNRWSWTYDRDHIQINISWPYLSENLQEWDDSVPDGCNYSLLLISDFPLIDYEQDKYNSDFVISVLIPKYVAVLRNIAGEVYYHSGNHHAEYVKELLTITP
ncbi:hypothetical protein [Brevibacillus brevis]|uniref:Uncharacterized protein n=1 Tax=Brevibacillus brevis TaxID=1393 RepID=A0A517I3X1_BREBE|nr:hypothetical protein [Brevibacillus brevis]QDS33601.1 hypothetical protein FPS98_06115 [Brevibacillus brevis]